MSDGLEQVRKLQAAVVREAEKLHLEVAFFAVIPNNEPGGRDILNITFKLTPEAVETADETMQRSVDSEFENLFAKEFGDTLEFADDDTVSLMQKEEERAKAAEIDIQKLIDEFEGDDK